MKKYLIPVLLIMLAAGVYLVVDFSFRNLRGSGPAFSEPEQDITALLPPSSQSPAVPTAWPLQLPAGFDISIYAQDLKNPRVMLWDNSGQLLVSIPALGQVVALADADGDGFAETHRIVLQDLDRPHGLALRCTDICRLYVAESGRVVEYDYASFDGQAAEARNPRTVAELPAGGNHFSRTIMFRPFPHDNQLLISVGSSCNVCNEQDWRRAKILVFDLATGELKEFARGLRNSVFLAIHPATGQIWATEMGRDLIGDDLPPDEVNIIEEGKNYGWPICYGQNVHDTDFDRNTYIRNPCQEPLETPSQVDLPAHSAPLGLAFIPEEGWPEEYRHDALVAYHGSWNRTIPTGYKIVRLRLDDQGNYAATEDFITGWLPPDSRTALGRPVDILIQPGGVIYISDDKAGVIYRVRRTTGD